MSPERRAAVPPPLPAPFEGAIRHPDLWLWDSWVAGAGGAVDLYCLALSRRAADGAPIAPAQRNDFAFHVRRFRSADGGRSWRDAGCVIQPSAAAGGAFARNIWSGSALDLPDGSRLHGFTGVREAGAGRPFLQTLFLATGANAEAAPVPADTALLCPARDYDRIREAGYYLGPRETLGAAEGEGGGPILAWRDPFLILAAGGAVEMLWSAKTGPRTPAIGRALLREDRGVWSVAELYAPAPVPDAALMTQAEVPKLVQGPDGGWIMLLSASDRVSEIQPDSEVSKRLRLYAGPSAAGPWRPWSDAGSALPGLDHVFGASILTVDFETRTLSLVCPLSEYAATDQRLTIGAVQSAPMGVPAG